MELTVAVMTRPLARGYRPSFCPCRTQAATAGRESEVGLCGSVPTLGSSLSPATRPRPGSAESWPALHPLCGDSHGPLGMKSLPPRQRKGYICSLGDADAMVNLACEGTKPRACALWRDLTTPTGRAGGGDAGCGGRGPKEWEAPLFCRPKGGSVSLLLASPPSQVCHFYLPGEKCLWSRGSECPPNPCL